MLDEIWRWTPFFIFYKCLYPKHSMYAFASNQNESKKFVWSQNWPLTTVIAQIVSPFNFWHTFFVFPCSFPLVPQSHSGGTRKCSADCPWSFPRWHCMGSRSPCLLLPDTNCIFLLFASPHCFGCWVFYAK